MATNLFAAKPDQRRLPLLFRSRVGQAQSGGRPAVCFEQAHQGTLLLDEIADMRLASPWRFLHAEGELPEHLAADPPEIPAPGASSLINARTSGEERSTLNR
jgi:hypothetical protein